MKAGVTPSHARWLTFAAMVLSASVLAGGRGDPEAYPRARAAATSQRLAAAIERNVSPLTPAVPALVGARGAIEFQRLLGGIFLAMDSYASAENHLRRAYAIATAIGDAEDAAAAAIDRGEIALLTGQYDRAERLSSDLAQLATGANLPWAQAKAEEYLGVVARRRGRLDDAQAHAQRALALQRALGQEAGTATALSNLGTLARDRGDYATALDLFRQALAIRERGDDLLELTLRNLALIYRDLGDDASARDYFGRALEVARRHGDSANYAATLGTWAGYLVDSGEFAPALAAAEESLAVSSAIGDRPSVGFDLLNSGRALLGLGRSTEADARLHDALAIGRELNQHEIIAHSQVSLAEAALARGDAVRANRLLQAAFADPQTARYKPLMVEVNELREKIATAIGQPVQALHYAHAAAALREELLGTRARRRLAALESQYARTAADQQLALATKENQLQAARLTQQHLQRNYVIVAACGLGAILLLLAWRFAGVRRLNRALAARNAEVETQRAALSNANDRLQQQADELFQAAISDPLTGVSNRGHLMRQLDARIADCARNGGELAALLIDFDHFKRINDAHGHLYGDRVLVAGVQTLRQWLEPGDLLGRYGGEEFIAALSGRDAANAIQVADRLRTRVAEAMTGFLPEANGAVTVSIGIAILSHLPGPARLEMLIEAADKAVYAAKAAGRNRVVVHAA
ncbi:MAG: GGDEF domain-containing protein [Xanthomonadaceae bacterium]|nr:GGDEF domain-containing protein [Xanthomonadaceae bacterium]